MQLSTKARIYLALGLVSFFAVPTYVESYYLRKKKGIRKLAQIYLRDNVGKDSLSKKRELKNQIETSEEMHLYHASLLQYLKSSFEKPFGLLFPKRLESVQKMVKISQKYGIGILNQDLDDLHDYQQKFPDSLIIDEDDQEYLQSTQSAPYVIINQKHLNNIEFDNITGICKAGSGCKIEDINNYLKSYGYEINIPNVDPQTRLYKLLNENESFVKSFTYTSIGQLVKGLTVVIGDGRAIEIGMNQQISYGQDLRGIFIGQNATNGIIIEAKLQAEPIVSETYTSKIKLNSQFLSQTSTYYLIEGLYKYLHKKENNCYDFKFKFGLQYSQNEGAQIYAECQKELNIEQILNKHVNEYVYRQLWNQSSLGNKEEQKNNNYSTKLTFQVDGRILCDSLLNFEKFVYKDLLSEMNVDANFQKNILTFSFNDEKLGKRTLPFARALTSYINTYQGKYINCTNKTLNLLLKQETIPYEQGLNHYGLTNEIISLLDPKKIFLNSNYYNEDLKPTIE